MKLIHNNICAFHFQFNECVYPPSVRGWRGQSWMQTAGCVFSLREVVNVNSVAMVMCSVDMARFGPLMGSEPCKAMPPQAIVKQDPPLVAEV